MLLELSVELESMQDLKGFCVGVGVVVEVGGIHAEGVQAGMAGHVDHPAGSRLLEEVCVEK